MKKALMVAGGCVALGVVGGRVCSIMCKNIDWEKRFEAMPETCPPKWMFGNISAIRHSTDRILELLEHEPGQSAPPVAAAD